MSESDAGNGWQADPSFDDAVARFYGSVVSRAPRGHKLMSRVELGNRDRPDEVVHVELAIEHLLDGRLTVRLESMVVSDGHGAS